MRMPQLSANPAAEWAAREAAREASTMNVGTLLVAVGVDPRGAITHAPAARAREQPVDLISKRLIT